MVTNANSLKEAKKAKRKSDKRLSKANYKFDVYGDVWQLDSNFQNTSIVQITGKINLGLCRLI